MSSTSTIFGTKAYVCARYFLRPGKCFKYIGQRGEDISILSKSTVVKNADTVDK